MGMKKQYKPRSYVVELLEDEIKETAEMKAQTDFTKGYKMGLRFALLLLMEHKVPPKSTKG